MEVEVSADRRGWRRLGTDRGG